MASEKFCLRWNDFENNIGSAFRELRDDKDFFDVTLACEDEQISAHKVILSACSPFFRNTLRRNPHQHPLLYLKGVKYTDLQSVLNFMYHGEVNIAQEELNSFLSVAEDLRVKGLTQGQTGSRSKERSPPPPPPPVSKHETPPVKSSIKEAKYSRPPPVPPVHQPALVDDQDDIQEVTPIKSEPRESHSTQAAQYTPAQPVALTQPESHSLTSYQEETQEYEDYGYEAQQYGDDDTSLGQGQGGLETGKAPPTERTVLNDYITKDPETGMFSCQFCGKSNIQKNNIRNHIEGVHFPGQFVYKCDQCNKDFNGKNSLSVHLSKYHGNVNKF